MANRPENYGPNHEAVSRFIAELPEYPWFTALGQPTDDDASLIRVGLEDVIRLRRDPYRRWGRVLPEQEYPIDRLILDNSRLGADDAVQRNAGITGRSVEHFYESLAVEYPDYYRNHTFVWELIHLPQRLVLYAAREVLVQDLAPQLHFFGDLMEWFRRGHWPVGWKGAWPRGKLILW